MGYPAMTRAMTATETTTGTMTFTMESIGFYTDDGRTAVYVGDTPYKSWHVTLSGSDKVTIQGNNNDPDVTADWFTISQASVSETITNQNAMKFFRANVDNISGSITVNFYGVEG